MTQVIISVRGEHETRIAPERAVVHLTVRAESRDRGSVVERIAALTEPVRDDLASRKDAGAVAEWSSQRVAVWSDRPWGPDGKRQPVVHHATVEFTATFSDFAAMSWWAGDVVDREGVQLGWIDWQLTPETRARVERDVATEAVAVAVARARAYASALGLGDVVATEVADVGLLRAPEAADAGPARPMMARAAFSAPAGASAPVVQFEPEDLEITAAVEARFSAR